ncbi:hypothetical protein AVEN_48490-1 [Araneus ventricosus]|uniref:Uncharacterized protein n=1 Tax=Araneus ventricosus TaxID=182803 RepID=A0A4Y2FAZ7_ARAVE|nr:hypothetical protein AVEN_48490-1 [Araneus ventricosus]
MHFFFAESTSLQSIVGAPLAVCSLDIEGREIIEEISSSPLQVSQLIADNFAATGARISATALSRPSLHSRFACKNISCVCSLEPSAENVPDFVDQESKSPGPGSSGDLHFSSASQNYANKEIQLHFWSGEKEVLYDTNTMLMKDAFILEMESWFLLESFWRIKLNFVYPPKATCSAKYWEEIFYLYSLNMVCTGICLDDQTELHSSSKRTYTSQRYWKEVFDLMLMLLVMVSS